jgi:GTP diphosphokinase / guanosine-3',5'-bis(diphosphate) 3'-diphosphatase
VIPDTIERAPAQSGALLIQAAHIVAEWHANQRRKGAAAEPYVDHLLEVAALVSEVTTDPDVIIAALCHDAIEDQQIPADTIANYFGRHVADIVLEVTDDKTLPKAQRKALQVSTAAGKSREARLVKIADKISNVRSIKRSPPAEWSERQKLDYVQFCRDVVAQCRGTSAHLESIFNSLSG